MATSIRAEHDPLYAALLAGLQAHPEETTVQGFLDVTPRDMKGLGFCEKNRDSTHQI
jgi:hypothetical protein